MKKLFVLGLFVFLMSCASMRPAPTEEAQEGLNHAVKLEVRVASMEAGKTVVHHGTGTGTVVAKAKNGSALILTAAHVCRPQGAVAYVLQAVERSEETVPATVLNYSYKHDLCLVSAPLTVVRPADVARYVPPVGAKVHYADGLLYGPALVAVRDGRYAGDTTYGDDNDRDFTVLTTQAHGGDSGAGVYYHGRLFAVVLGGLSARGETSGARVTLCATMRQIRSFLEE
jgi:hypothetical protein